MSRKGLCLAMAVSRNVGIVLRPSYPITTERLLLRPFTLDDFADVYAYQSRVDVTRYLYWGPRSADDVRRDLPVKTKRTALWSEGDSLNLAVELRGSGTIIGDVVLFWVSAGDRQGEIGFVFHPDYHGRGFAREAAEVLLGLGFDELGLHRIVGRCDGRNDASAKVMARLGMRREAHFRENEFVKGEWTDELVYAMLDREWKVRRV